MPDIEFPGPNPNDDHDDLRSPPTERNSAPINARQLRDEARVRAKKLPVLQRIMKHFSSTRDTYRELIINSESLEKRVALLTNGVLEKFDIERKGESRMAGSIFKGRVQNLEHGLKAAFVDIGQAKNAFLHYWDMLPAANDSSVEFIRDNESAEQKKNRTLYTTKDIPTLFPVGSEIVIQVTKEQIGTKGPRTTTNIALPGRFIVLMPFSGQCGISRKIEDSVERERLKRILREVAIPEGMGIIIRTAGEGKRRPYFVRDLHMLLKKWERICHIINNTTKPAVLHQEPGLVERTVRDFLTEDIDRILVDSQEDYESILQSVAEISPRSKNKVVLYRANIPIFERFNIERQIEQTFQRRVPLPSGGEIVIDETEALTAIDVNTGGHKGANKDGKDFILQANLEAVREAARQIRLRNLGGLVIIDTIDMKNPRDRRDVHQALRDEMANDRAKSQILPISMLGIIQMTRQRQTESNTTGIYTSCPYCHGRGIVKNPRTMSVEIQRRLISIIRRFRSQKENTTRSLSLRVFLHPINLERLREEDRGYLEDMERAYKVHLAFRADPSYHVENFKIINVETGDELR
ncbi:MAG: Rne/Rng family ribonuclease [Puniceicoccales bacterium]|jgi:ribonuclease G|nr:Rne/Rng family ribonuclease [Puniceicoccales bacterium]